ncbi:putative uracil-DNA glycosylase [Actinoplanes missouriensis 431]|uniref:Type-4 uracil-DNA glycosylase n=1 Tax=Actinoplanes missouriensis (strain ATCC 14538 / DSM 43046 / CBS 188.64 / JCM 3121 / NBRC 102363 / NCIMB 12654 / NRRL B-3342 / UNCC 431) TaxID=512565 RepID=I0HGJ5_ACTM4|nr:UdgX family uracil-DNA binding protein [Actinoplanes missouriensis]BAL92132.1 putative uracil-DNA glycosylase [Actinoplanes missouriensis 431]
MSSTEAPPGAQQWVPPQPRDIAELKAAAAGCRGCELFQDATQTVFGRGAEDARIVFVGEQPGDVEDQHGLPFVGPAGRLLREAVDDAGIDPAQLYITNAVKHFRFEMRGKRRIHQTPGPTHITACRPWLVAEFSRLQPELVVLLGATAAKALLGPSFRVTRSRGRLMPWPASAQHPEDFPVAEIQALATIHPSAVLRADNRDAAYRGLVDDLKVAATV